MPFDRLPLLWPAIMWVGGMALVAIWWGVDVRWWLLCSLFILLLWWHWRWQPWLLLLLLLAMVWAMAMQVWLDRQQQMDSRWSDGAVTVDATVVGVQQTSHRQRLTLRAVQRSDGAELRGDVWCYLYGKQQQQEIRVGDHLHGMFRLHRPRSHHNPGGFDFVSYARQHHIALLGSSRSPLQIEPDATLLAMMRDRVHAALQRLDVRSQAVLSALLLADRSLLSDSQWQRFSASGTAHLLAISGLHVGMVASWGFILVWWLLTRREAWIVQLSVRRYALGAGVLLAVGYATLAGWSLPTQRAVLMLTAAAIAWWLRSRSHPFNTMLAALMVVLLLDPLSVVSISLWLSFVAVTALIIWGMREEQHLDEGRWRRSFYALLWVSVVASLATLPLISGVFGRFPLYSLPANLLLVPLYGLWILPSALSAAVLAIVGWSGGAHGLLLVAGAGVALGEWLLQLLYALPGGSWWLPQLPIWWLFLVSVLLLVAGVLWWKQHRTIALASLLCSLLMLVAWPESHVQRTAWAVWDVGQGAAATIRFADGKVMAIDAPGQRGSRFNGGSTVADGLRVQGVTHLDVVVVSHLQSDHAGGISTLLRRMNLVRELWLADVPANHNARQVRYWQWQLQRLGGDVRWLAQGDVAMVGGHQVRVLWPPRHAHRSNANNLSLVLSIALDDQRRMLVMGDSEAPVERALLKTALRHHDLLLVPHHGSASSSTQLFVERVHPEVAVMQTGFGNRFHFPNPLVTARYRQVGAEIANTAAGAVLGEVKDDLLWQQMTTEDGP